MIVVPQRRFQSDGRRPRPAELQSVSHSRTYSRTRLCRVLQTNKPKHVLLSTFHSGSSSFDSQKVGPSISVTSPMSPSVVSGQVSVSSPSMHCTASRHAHSSQLTAVSMAMCLFQTVNRRPLVPRVQVILMFRGVRRLSVPPTFVLFALLAASKVKPRPPTGDQVNVVEKKVEPVVNEVLEH